ncbi:hypothetical protein BCR33DRAFT_795555 [Rhizoclosmatium globosum]|uniref:DUF6729 domain-containing protein n=1 Tax=Rhizoclosmatium globosum TaxID=329046 RepID=A0A1Y2ARW5_9FUNG|nr:hypothetical protein BCR33DRAFT_795555 [Rhizoclosmatium globosum]|eukprot:ORY25040.1 hypothetical protein BCR33DRAFT_795555 [Rhizoclosmatium globosum]
MLTTNTTNSSNRPPPPGSLPSNNQPPKKAKTGSSSITSFFSRASVNPNFAALQNAAQTAPSSPAGSSTAQIPSGRNAINRNGHGGKRANSGRKRKQPEIAKDVSSDSEPETPQPPEPSQLETIHTNPLTIITNKPTVETMKDARARLGWNELSDTSDSSDDDMCSLASDSEDEEHQQTLPFFVDDDEPDLSLQDLVVNAVDPDSIPSVQLSVTNPDDDMPAPQTNNIPIQRKRVSEFIGQSPTDKYLQLCLNALNKTYDVHKDDSVSLLEKNTYGRKVKDLRERIMTGLKDGHSIIYPPRPEVVLRRNLELGLAPSPDPFCVPPVRFFESHISSSVLPCCNNNVCEFNGKNEKMSFRGWSSRPRRLFGTSDKLMYYLFTARYKCGACAKEWYGTTTEMMKSLPHEVQLSFEVLLSQRSGVDLEIVEDIGIDIKMGPTAARDKYAEKARKRHTKLQLSYYSTIESFLRQRKSQPSANVSAFKFLFNADGTLQMNNITKFPNFFDPYYGGEIMSADWLLKMFKDLMSSRRSYMDGEVQRRFSSNGIYSLDHTFRTLHGIGLQNGQRPVAATFNLRNDNGEIRINDLLPSAGHSAMEVPLISLKTTMDAAGIGHPEIAFTDKCCSDSDFLLRIFPSLSSHVKDMDFASIPSSVETVSYGRDNLTALGLKCTSLLEFAKRSRIFMSVDCEWDTLNNRKVGKVPVITFAVNHPKPFVAFINLDPSQPFPLELKALLQNKNVTKVGSHIFHDARHLLADYGVELVEAECVRLEKLCKTNNWSPSAKLE